MQIHTEKAGDASRVSLAGEMTIYSASDLKSKLLGALVDCAELEISMAEVTEMDTAGVQLLLLAKQEAARSGKVIHLTTPSPAVREVLECYRMTPYLDDPQPVRSASGVETVQTSQHS